MSNERPAIRYLPRTSRNFKTSKAQTALYWFPSKSWPKSAASRPRRFSTAADFRGQPRTHLTNEEYELHGSRIIDSMTTEDSITLGKVNFMVGAILVLGGLLATLFGGWLGDLRRRLPGSYFLVSGYSAVLAFPLFLGMLYVPFPYAWGLMFLTVFGLFVNTGPANTILANVTAPTMRATGFAFNILIIHLLGDAISPAIIGYIADQTSLTRAFEFVAFFTLTGGLVWIWGARYLDRDTQAAGGEIQPAEKVIPG